MQCAAQSVYACTPGIRNDFTERYEPTDSVELRLESPLSKLPCLVPAIDPSVHVFWKVTRCVETAAVAETCCAGHDPGVTPACAQVGRATGCCMLGARSGIMAYDQADRPLSPASDASDLFEAQEQAAEAMKQQLVKAATIALHCKQYSSHTRLKVRACDVGMAPAPADNPARTPNKQGAVRTDYRTRKARGAPQTRYCSACARVDTE